LAVVAVSLSVLNLEHATTMEKGCVWGRLPRKSGFLPFPPGRAYPIPWRSMSSCLGGSMAIAFFS
jgi:hypothetical protein